MINFVCRFSAHTKKKVKSLRTKCLKWLQTIFQIIFLLILKVITFRYIFYPIHWFVCSYKETTCIVFLLQKMFYFYFCTKQKWFHRMNQNAITHQNSSYNPIWFQTLWVLLHKNCIGKKQMSTGLIEFDIIVHTHRLCVQKKNTWF